MILALLLLAQDAAKIRQEVEYANHPDKPQLHLRAVDRLVARGAGAVTPEILDFVGKRGRNALSISFTEGLGKLREPRLTALLVELVGDAEFFWRPSAMRALARHADPSSLDVFRAGLEDRLWGVRAAAIQGIEALGDRKSAGAVRELLGDEVYDVRAQAARTLHAFGDTSGLPILVEALRSDTVWFDIDYGQLAREDAWKFLTKVAGDDFGYKPWEPAEKRAPGLAKFEAWIARTIPDWRDRVPEKARVKAEKTDYVFGYELRSCQRGDFFFRLDAGGNLVLGYFNLEKARLTPEELGAFRAALGKLEEVDRSLPYGEGGCDFEQYYIKAGPRFEKLWVGLRGRPDGAEPFLSAAVKLIRAKFGEAKARELRSTSRLFQALE